MKIQKRSLPNGDILFAVGKNGEPARPIVIAAKNDYEAIAAWLREYADAPKSTQRAYKKEIERLLYWCAKYAERPVSGLTREDLQAYEAWLRSPPQEDIGQPCRRSDPRWRPLRGPLKQESVAYAMRILNNMFAWLVNAGYLQGNPLSLMRNRKRTTQSERALERYLPTTAWRALADFVRDGAGFDDEFEQRRARIMVFGLYYLAARRSELVATRMKDFVHKDSGWWWRVRGKGGKLAEIPVHHALMNEIMEYRRVLALPPAPTSADQSFLLRHKNGKPVHASWLYRVFRDICARCADMIEDEMPSESALLRCATPHWLRHTALSHAARRMPIQMVQALGRHSRMETAAIYQHIEGKAFSEAVHGAFGGI